MIFYFSGQLPLGRPRSSDDPDILFFKDRDNGKYDRLVCLMYGSEQKAIMENIKLVGEKHGTSKSECADEST